MQVRLQHHFESDCYRIWVIQRSPFSVLRPGPRGSWIFTIENPEENSAPSLELPVDVLQALLQEAGKVLPATHATERHLLDTIAVRDRLLSLVEIRP